MPGRRAKRACLRCRERKVRCNVTLGGIPCLNCRLDDHICEVRKRASRYDPALSFTFVHKPIGDATHVPEPIGDGLRINGQQESQMAFVSQEGTDNTLTIQSRQPTPTPGPLEVQIAENTNDQAEAVSTDTWVEMAPTLGSQMLESEAQPDIGIDLDALFQTSAPMETQTELFEFLSEPENPSQLFGRLIKPPDLSQLPLEDIAYLRGCGCTQLLPKPVLDELVRAFFLHVHPIVPLLDEAAFWDLYSGRCGIDAKKISLLVFQAILFASCNFITETVSESLGFSSPRSAAASFYKRAKLLHDFETESCPVDIAQAAILLTFWPGHFGSAQTRPNTAWLTVAITNAQSAQAHRMFDGFADSPYLRISTPTKRCLRRLWWCCIFRDRSLALGLRRTVQIQASYPPLEQEDFRGEMEASLVYSSDTKQQLFQILVHVSKLFTLLTDLLQMTSLSEDGLRRQHTMNSGHLCTLDECDAHLHSWYQEAVERFQNSVTEKGPKEQPVLLYTNLMFIYYFTSKLVLHRQEILIGLYLSGWAEGLPPTLHGKNLQVREAAIGLIEHLTEPAQRGFVHCFPISVVAFAAAPLTMHIIEAKLLSSSPGQTKSTSNQLRLYTLIQVMRQHRPRAFAVEAMSSLIRRVVDIAEEGLTFESSGSIMSWSDIIAHRPLCYLQLTMKLDISLSWSNPPESCGSPQNLSGLFANNQSTILYQPSPFSYSLRSKQRSPIGTPNPNGNGSKSISQGQGGSSLPIESDEEDPRVETDGEGALCISPSQLIRDSVVLDMSTPKASCSTLSFLRDVSSPRVG
ncbi:fungal-specific transcription factor domain-containing protein [Thelonectria olida]|uniref:Fungal-specific transcription factor domain-containing protein n=1 Tax=Thelonectria olida TaxID=1576542 RepID=A0A9P8VV19_9HYPO|nr:fungal-specific transcription factor domain-containing protein [Thelonectria olida]